MSDSASYGSGPVCKRLCSAMFTMLMTITLTMASVSSAGADDARPQPGSQYAPEDVVRIVIESLQNNDTESDRGIATVWRFASPGNRAFTGPLPRFARMIKQGFPDMLNHSSARYESMEISGDKAAQAVWLTSDSGTETGYAFQLSKQKTGEFQGAWMTDAVIPLGQSAESGIRI